jgi:two-component system osmolarity sensor histidine kinase EnvZ
LSVVPRTLFGKTAVTLTVAAFYFALFTFTAVVYYVQVPVARQAADDLATFLVLAGATWAVLPPPERDRYAAELERDHRISVKPAAGPVEERPPYRPFLMLLERAVERRTGVPAVLREDRVDGEQWYWLELAGPAGAVWVGFPGSRLGARTPTALMTVLIGSSVLVLVTAMSLASRITKPLSLLSDAAARIGRGQLPEPLPERGPTELAALIREFNRMAHQVRELLANRTTLLAGISHDLRTPLARLRIAVAMLPEGTDPDLVEGMVRDIEGMDRLIHEALELGRDLTVGAYERVDLTALVGELAEEARRAGGDVRWAPGAACRAEVNASALRRVIDNLLGNALRYGRGAPVDLELTCGPGGPVVGVLDRGPGIPAAEREAVFRPFFRLERSRSVETGGSGLGLAIARQLADANGWQIALADREGGGLVARVTIPTEPGDRGGERHGG